MERIIQGQHHTLNMTYADKYKLLNGSRLTHGEFLRKRDYGELAEDLYYEYIHPHQKCALIFKFMLDPDIIELYSGKAVEMGKSLVETTILYTREKHPDKEVDCYYSTANCFTDSRHKDTCFYGYLIIRFYGSNNHEMVFESPTQSYIYILKNYPKDILNGLDHRWYKDDLYLETLGSSVYATRTIDECNYILNTQGERKLHFPSYYNHQKFLLFPRPPDHVYEDLDLRHERNIAHLLHLSETPIVLIRLAMLDKILKNIAQRLSVIEGVIVCATRHDFENEEYNITTSIGCVMACRRGSDFNRKMKIRTDKIITTCLNPICNTKTEMDTSHYIALETTSLMFKSDEAIINEYNTLVQIFDSSAPRLQSYHSFLAAPTTEALREPYNNMHPGYHMLSANGYRITDLERQIPIETAETTSFFNIVRNEFVVNIGTINIINSEAQINNTSDVVRPVAVPEQEPFISIFAETTPLDFTREIKFRFRNWLIQQTPPCFAQFLAAYLDSETWKICESNLYICEEGIWSLKGRYQDQRGLIMNRVNQFFTVLRRQITTIYIQSDFFIETVTVLETKVFNSSFFGMVFSSLHALLLDDDFIRKLDANWHLIGYTDCLYNLKSSLSRQILPSDFISIVQPYTFMPRPKDFLYSFFESVFLDEQERLYFLNVIASCLDEKIRNDKIYFWIGEGSNGKSAMATLIRGVFGDFLKSIPSNFFNSPLPDVNSPSPLYHTLRKKKIGILTEPNDVPMNAEIVKRFCGTDEIDARTLFGKNTDFIVRTKFFVLTNNIPKFTVYDFAIWRRFAIIPFRRVFVSMPLGDDEAQIIEDTEIRLRHDKEIHAAFLEILIEFHSKLTDKHIEIPPSINAIIRSNTTEEVFFYNWLKSNIEYKAGSMMKPFDLITEFYKYRIKLSEENVYLDVPGLRNSNPLPDSKRKEYRSHLNVLRNFIEEYNNKPCSNNQRIEVSQPTLVDGKTKRVMMNISLKVCEVISIKDEEPEDPSRVNVVSNINEDIVVSRIIEEPNNIRHLIENEEDITVKEIKIAQTLTTAKDSAFDKVNIPLIDREYPSNTIEECLDPRSSKFKTVKYNLFSALKEERRNNDSEESED